MFIRLTTVHSMFWRKSRITQNVEIEKEFGLKLELAQKCEDN